MIRKKYKQAGSTDTLELLRQGAAIIDVRRQDEWQLTGVVAGSHPLTFFDALGNSQPDEWLQQLDQLVPVGQPLLLI